MTFDLWEYDSFDDVTLETSALAYGAFAVVREVCGDKEYLPRQFRTSDRSSIDEATVDIRELIQEPHSNDLEMILLLCSELSWATVPEPIKICVSVNA
jgi:hypothetical protein